MKIAKILTGEEIKHRVLNVLIEIDNFCKTNGLTYWLAYGTLLGAVRHQGFIPWDDDIDLWMPRPDYEKFIHTFKSDSFQVLYHKDYRWNTMITKVCDKQTLAIKKDCGYKGVFVDVFPIDGLSSDFKTAQKQFISCRRRLNRYNQILSIRNQKVTISNFFYSIPIKLIFTDRFIHKTGDFVLDKMYKYKYSESLYFTCLYGGTNKIVTKDFVENTVHLPFEGQNFPAPVMFDKWLTLLYGNYLKLPPVEQQISLHDYDYYVLDSQVDDFNSLRSDEVDECIKSFNETMK